MNFREDHHLTEIKKTLRPIKRVIQAIQRLIPENEISLHQKLQELVNLATYASPDRAFELWDRLEQLVASVSTEASYTQELNQLMTGLIDYRIYL